MICSVNKTSLTINLSIDQYDTLIESIAKANALIQVVLILEDLEQMSHALLHDYFWALSDYLQKIDDISDKIKPLTI